MTAKGEVELVVEYTLPGGLSNKAVGSLGTIEFTPRTASIIRYDYQGASFENLHQVSHTTYMQ
jgi:hypothetical protein